MAPTLEALGIDRLSIEDRIALAQAIWDSIPPEGHEPLLTEAASGTATAAGRL